MPRESVPASPALVADLRVAPRRHSDLRIWAVRSAMRTAAFLGGRALYRRRHLRAGRFAVRTELVRVPDLPAGLEGFEIVQLSDLHAGAFLARGDLADVVAAANAREPDLCVLTGDFVTDAWHEALLVLDDLAGLRARHGTFAVFGNHDYRGRREDDIAAAYAERGIAFLRDRTERIDTGAGALALVGLEDLEEAKHAVDLPRARAGVRPGDVEVALCHNPAGGPALARAGCALVLSGHTHGGQVDLPWLRRQGPPHPGLRVELGPTALIVSRGLGVIGLPLRVGAPAEIVCVRLTAAAPQWTR